tara:strand:- start:300 stop:551 length:252 start_codon:yes stop_codon:yes gene_type:complete
LRRLVPIEKRLGTGLIEAFRLVSRSFGPVSAQGWLSRLSQICILLLYGAASKRVSAGLKASSMPLALCQSPKQLPKLAKTREN